MQIFAKLNVNQIRKKCLSIIVNLMSYLFMHNSELCIHSCTHSSELCALAVGTIS